MTAAKSWNMKREKGEDGAEVTYGHLRFSDLFITREQVNQLLGQEDGWARKALFDELGAPRGRWSIVCPTLDLSVVGTVGDGEKDDRLQLLQATLGSIEVTLTNQGAVIAGQLTWMVAGDEAADCEPLLGRVCSVKWDLNNRQGDMLRDAA
ncbi:MAG: hypothetical protein Q8N51_00760 [Gammaproteobacteria bacterium]|nr:hypothetical protein [Gammaproteobacteria bacterium]